VRFRFSFEARQKCLAKRRPSGRLRVPASELSAQRQLQTRSARRPLPSVNLSSRRRPSAEAPSEPRRRPAGACSELRRQGCSGLVHSRRRRPPPSADSERREHQRKFLDLLFPNLWSQVSLSTWHLVNPPNYDWKVGEEGRWGIRSRVDDSNDAGRECWNWKKAYPKQMVTFMMGHTHR